MITWNCKLFCVLIVGRNSVLVVIWQNLGMFMPLGSMISDSLGFRMIRIMPWYDIECQSRSRINVSFPAMCFDFFWNFGAIPCECFLLWISLWLGWLFCAPSLWGFEILSVCYSSNWCKNLIHGPERCCWGYFYFILLFLFWKGNGGETVNSDISNDCNTVMVGNGG